MLPSDYTDFIKQLINCASTEGMIIGGTRGANLSYHGVNTIVSQYRRQQMPLLDLLSDEDRATFELLLGNAITYEEFQKQHDFKVSKTPTHLVESKQIGGMMQINPHHFENSFHGYLMMLQKACPQVAQQLFRWFEPPIADSFRCGHTYITGMTGSGKSELMKTFIVNHIQRRDCAVVVIDPKGDLALQVPQFKEFLDPQQQERLVVIDPYLSASHTPIINPFDQFGQDEHQIDLGLQEITRTFGEIFSQKGADFSNRMETLLMPAIATLLRKKDGSLWDLQRFMTDDNEDLIELGKQNPVYGQRKIFIDGDFQDSAYRETKRGIYSRLQFLLSTNTFANLTTGRSTINLKQALDDKKVIVFNLAKGRMGKEASETYGRMLLTLIQTIAIQRDGKPMHQRIPCHLFIDEFQNYVGTTIKDILAELRAYRLYLTIANQLVGQDMDTNLTRMIAQNTAIKAIGVSGRFNIGEMSKEMGVDTERLNKLIRGEFFIRIGNGEPFILRVTKRYADFSYCMTAEEWETCKIKQLATYYVPRNREIQRIRQRDEARERKKNAAEPVRPQGIKPKNPPTFPLEI